MPGKNTARIFTPANNYRVVPMRSDGKADALRLCAALSKGFVAKQDPDRDGFYSVQLGDRAFYIHAHETSKTLYILRTAPDSAIGETEDRPLSRTEQMTAACVPS